MQFLILCDHFRDAGQITSWIAVSVLQFCPTPVFTHHHSPMQPNTQKLLKPLNVVL